MADGAAEERTPPLDPELEAYLNQTRDIDVPDLWPKVEPPDDDGWEAWRRISTFVWLGVLAGAVVFGAVLARPNPDEQFTIEETSPSEPRPNIRTAPAPDRDDDDNSERFDGGPLTSHGTRTSINRTGDEGNTAIFDINLQTGERFRLTMPRHLADEITTVRSSGVPNPLDVSGFGITKFHVRFSVCPNVDQMTVNSGGSLVGWGADGTVVFCRPDELLFTTFTTGLEVNEEHLDQFDLRPVDVGTEYRREVMKNFSQRLCQDCANFGPVRYGDVIINQTGPNEISAVAERDLSSVWTFSSRNAELHLTGIRPTTRHRTMDEGIWLTTSDSRMIVLDPATGDVRWTLPIGPAETRFELYERDPGPWILASSYELEGDHTAPRLRSIDPDTGQVLWTADGREGAEWAWDGVAFTDDVLLAVDVYDNPDEPILGQGSTIQSFALADGSPLFTTELNAPAGAYTYRRLLNTFQLDSDLVLLASTANGLLSRIDVDTGEVYWTTRIHSGNPKNLVEQPDDSLSVRITSLISDQFYDLETGQRLVDPSYPSAPDGCVALRGARPVITLPGDLPDCLVAGEFQDIHLENDGDEPITVTFTDVSSSLAAPIRRTIEPGDTLATGPLGNVLSIGATALEISGSGAAPLEHTLWIAAAESSPLVEFQALNGRFGPVAVGMTLEEASASLGVNVVQDLDLGPGCAAVEGDPFSPLFALSSGEEVKIRGIVSTAVGGQRPNVFGCTPR